MEITKIDKDGYRTVDNISYKIKLIDSARFMASSSSNLVDNLTGGIHKIKYKDCDYYLEYEGVMDDLIKYKCLSCNKEYSDKVDEELKKKFKNTFKFSNHDIKNYILLLRKGVYPYECTGDWEEFNEMTLHEKEEFYINLNMEEITDADYMYRRKDCKDFEIKKIRWISWFES